MVFTTLSLLLAATAALPFGTLVRASPIGVINADGKVDVRNDISVDIPVGRSTVVTSMSAAQETSYTPFALFASAAYCPATQTATWSCGG